MRIGVKTQVDVAAAVVVDGVAVVVDGVAVVVAGGGGDVVQTLTRVRQILDFDVDVAAADDVVAGAGVTN